MLVRVAGDLGARPIWIDRLHPNGIGESEACVIMDAHCCPAGIITRCKVGAGWCAEALSGIQGDQGDIANRN